MARPQKEIDWSMFESLCQLQCTQPEIAAFLKISDETLRIRSKEHYGMDDYLDIYKRFAETGKCSLRRNQFVLSKKNAAIAIWLGKQWLGQRDYDKSEKIEHALLTLTHILQQIDNTSKDLVPTAIR